MKKILLSLLVVAGLGAVNETKAQLADGSIAPNFTITDHASGTTHTLYDYLDQGYTVVVDMFATWCGPCWSYHDDGILEDLYLNHGPAGAANVLGTTSDQIMVIALDADASTTDTDLTTAGDNGSGTISQGDWVTGTLYPMSNPSNASAINSDYQIAYFPTIYMICPNRTIREVGQLSNASAYLSAAGQCPAPASASIDAAVLGYTGETQACTGGNFTPEVFIQNNGTGALTAATIDVSQGGSVISTTNWTGNLATYDTEAVTMPAVTNYTPGTLTIEITAASDAAAGNNTKTQAIGMAPEVSNFITVDIYTDYWASEIDWRINTEAGSYVGGTASPTLVDNVQASYEYEITSLGCYEFVISDSYGDGIINGNTQAGQANGALWVGDHSGTTIYNNIDYGSGATQKFQVVVDATSVEEIGLIDFSVFPNPVSNIANIQFNLEGAKETTIEITNMVGQTVYAENMGELFGQQNLTVDCSTFESGIYMVNIKTNDITTSKRIVVSK